MILKMDFFFLQIIYKIQILKILQSFTKLVKKTILCMVLFNNNMKMKNWIIKIIQRVFNYFNEGLINDDSNYLTIEIIDKGKSVGWTKMNLFENEILNTGSIFNKKRMEITNLKLKKCFYLHYNFSLIRNF